MTKGNIVLFEKKVPAEVAGKKFVSKTFKGTGRSKFHKGYKKTYRSKSRKYR